MNDKQESQLLSFLQTIRKNKKQNLVIVRKRKRFYHPKTGRLLPQDAKLRKKRLGKLKPKMRTNTVYIDPKTKKAITKKKGQQLQNIENPMQFETRVRGNFVVVLSKRTECRVWISLRRSGLVPPKVALKATQKGVVDASGGAMAVTKTGKLLINQGVGPKPWEGNVSIQGDCGATILEIIEELIKDPVKLQRMIQRANREPGTKIHGNISVFYRQISRRITSRGGVVREHATIPGLPSFAGKGVINIGSGIFDSDNEKALIRLARTRGFVTSTDKTKQRRKRT